jgi:glycosyltransferase involved in cell wall biosynthesis
MRILIANYRYFISSGPERYMFNAMARLKGMGHEVFPFSVKFSKNQPTPYERFFVEPIGGQDEVFFEQHGKSPAVFLRGLSRLFYSREVERAITAMASEVKPDIAYVMCYLRKLSPSLLVGLKQHGVPIVVRLPDYGMLCPQLHCLRGSEPCTQCISQGPFASVRYGCVKGSKAISLLNYLATQFHKHRGYFNLIDAFVTTNQFMYSMMVKAGYDNKLLHCIPTFVDTDTFIPIELERGNFGVYVGRLDHPKGVHIILDAASKLKKASEFQGFHIKIAGSGHERDYVDSLHKQVSDHHLEDMIEFCGDISPKMIPELIGKARFSIIPSIWYENLPNTLLESFACGTPVFGSDIGSISMTIKDGKNGFLFTPGDGGSLADVIIRYLKSPDLAREMQKFCRVTAERMYSPEAHLKKLIYTFSDLVSINSVCTFN